jgi:hypothetical protein
VSSVLPVPRFGAIDCGRFNSLGPTRVNTQVPEVGGSTAWPRAKAWYPTGPNQPIVRAGMDYIIAVAGIILAMATVITHRKRRKS